MTPPRWAEKRPRPSRKILAAGAFVAFAGGLLVVSRQCAHTQATNAALPPPGVLRTGQAAFGGWTTDAPGVRRRITLTDLPAPYATASVDHGPQMVARPDYAWPKAPAGFQVQQYATDLDNPRKIVTAPNGDLFVAESGPGRIRVLRGVTADGHPAQNTVFASGLHQPFGIAFYPGGPHPQWVYVGDTDAVLRFPYRSGDTKARGPAETIVPDIPGGGRLRGGGHWTRDVVFSNDNKKMFVSVGSHSNVDESPWEHALEYHRADILQYNPDGTGFRLYATGIRNPVGLAVDPQTGVLWTSVNERDGLGDDLPPDYITHVTEGGFYGWPWYYLGDHPDPRHKGEHPELAGRITVPDVLIQAHSASLALTFYTGRQFPAQYRGQIFAAEHGSWNRDSRTGYKVIMAPVRDGKATGEYDDFLTGFVTPDGDVWGRPVGVAVGGDGSLFVADDGTNSIWRVRYVGAAAGRAAAR
ncbi:MAG: sorbosone dehydrogenase family protein [Armatimonadetes bacterium]|nr:sorbosone dehydrogenase family protein [Armatimonadota bacterium]